MNLYEHVCVCVFNTRKGSPSLKSREMMRSMSLSRLSIEKKAVLSNRPASIKSRFSLSMRKEGTRSSDGRRSAVTQWHDKPNIYTEWTPTFHIVEKVVFSPPDPFCQPLRNLLQNIWRSKSKPLFLNTFQSINDKSICPEIKVNIPSSQEPKWTLKRSKTSRVNWFTFSLASVSSDLSTARLSPPSSSVEDEKQLKKVWQLVQSVCIVTLYPSALFWCPVGDLKGLCLSTPGDSFPQESEESDRRL